MQSLGCISTSDSISILNCTDKMYLQYIDPVFPHQIRTGVQYDSCRDCQVIMNCTIWGSGMTQLWYSSLLSECIKEEKQLYRSGVVSMEHFACWGNNLALCPAKHGMRKEPWNAFVYPSDCTGSFNRALCASVDIQRERLLCVHLCVHVCLCALYFLMYFKQ